MHHEDFEDVAKWAEQQEWFQAPLAVVGHSMGGYSVARYAEDNPDKVAFCAPIAPVVSGRLTFDAHEEIRPDEFKKWKETGMLEKDSTSRAGVIKRSPWSHMEERLNHDLLPNADKLIMPVFLYVGTQDTSIPPKHVQLLYDAIPEGKKTLIIAEGAPHTYRTKEENNHLYESIHSWLKKLI